MHALEAMRSVASLWVLWLLAGCASFTCSGERTKPGLHAEQCRGLGVGCSGTWLALRADPEQQRLHRRVHSRDSATRVRPGVGAESVEADAGRLADASGGS